MRARSMPAPLRASAIVNASGVPYMVPATSHQAADYRSQELGGYNPRYFSTDAAWLPERQKVISRIQDLIRNDGWTSGTLNRYVDQAIGARFSLSYLPNHVALGITFEQAMEFRLQVETAWAQFAYDSRFLVDATERLNFAGLMGLAFRQRMAFGDALGIVNWIPNRPWFASRTALQLVSPSASRTRTAAPTPTSSAAASTSTAAARRCATGSATATRATCSSASPTRSNGPCRPAHLLGPGDRHPSLRARGAQPDPRQTWADLGGEEGVHGEQVRRRLAAERLAQRHARRLPREPARS
jgi:hypothetical protein